MTTIVFLGPSLPLQTAKNILPDAWYHGPAQCGDIIKILRLNPQRLLLIDGLYEKTASIWHKELLLAIDNGVEVYGASSMGALRAAELQKFGMHGVGKIFQDYADGVLTDDDEVAVLHTASSSGFAVLNEAMVNIRMTIANAIQHKVISKNVGEQIISAAKQLHYPCRSLKAACDQLPRLTAKIKTTLLEWCKRGNYIDQKSQDAIQALTCLQNTDVKPAEKKSITAPTGFIRHLCRIVNTSVFNDDYDFLPESEKNLIALKNNNSQQFQLLSRFAELLATCYDIALGNVSNLEKSSDAFLESIIFRYKNDGSLCLIYNWLTTLLANIQNLEETVTQKIRWLELIYEVKYNTPAEKNILSGILSQYALLWTALIHLVNEKKVKISKIDLNKKLSEFLFKRNSSSKQEILQWLDNRLPVKEFNQLLVLYAYLQIIFFESRHDFLLKKPQVVLLNWIEIAYSVTRC
jgi:hypothetical protein